MIITAPTGLYKPILPKKSSQSGNYSFTISNSPPPKSGQTFVQLPLPEVIRKPSDRIYSKSEKRAFLGDLVYDIAASGPPTTASGSTQFEIGQVLQFVENEDVGVDSYEFSREELRQDLKSIDFESVGLSEDQYLELINKSFERLDKITLEISEVSSELNSNKASIKAIQSKINNATELYSNIVVVLGEDSEQANTVKNSLEDLENNKDKLISDRNTLNDRLEELREEMRKVREVVR